jgi:hypothetical protein
MQSRTGIVEAMEKAENGMVQIHTILSVAQMLAFEINRGERFTKKVSPMLQAKDLCGTIKQTKRGVLRDYVAWMNEVLPGGYVAKDSVAKALTKPAK